MSKSFLIHVTLSESYILIFMAMNVCTRWSFDQRLQLRPYIGQPRASYFSVPHQRQCQY